MEKQNNIEAIKTILSSWREMELFSLKGSVAMLELMKDHGSNLSYFEDDIKSMSTCKRKAEAVLRKAYDAAYVLFDTKNSDGLCERYTKSYLNTLESDITRLKHHLRQLRKLEAENQATSEMERLLCYDTLRELINKTLCEELTENYRLYQFGAFSRYADYIKFEECDTTGIDNLNWLLKAISPNVYYQYDCSDAWEQLDADITDNVDRFNETASSVVGHMLLRKCIEPAELMLSEFDVV